MPDIMPKTYTKLYAVMDRVARDIFGGVIRCANDEVARRAFHDLLTQKDSPIAGHRGDYDLIQIGTIDNDGYMVPNELEAITIARGQDWLDANKETN